MKFTLVGPDLDRPVVLDDTCYFLAFDDERAARRALAALSSPLAQDFFAGRIFWDAKRPINKALLQAIDLAALGPVLEHDPLFPQRANIGVAAVRDHKNIRLRVWERGAGITRACGSGACAALVAAHRRGLAGRRAAVVLDGGVLDIAWREDGHVVMTGPVALSFEGAFDLGLLAMG